MSLTKLLYQHNKLNEPTKEGSLFYVLSPYMPQFQQPAGAAAIPPFLVSLAEAEGAVASNLFLLYFLPVGCWFWLLGCICLWYLLLVCRVLVVDHWLLIVE
jgi:hypothetical protein